ncbi:hypothetical protein ACFP51_27220 [Streptomyces pratens]|uniref:Uncharacterized protein n=1 Tax=Streptomyces pratens TaxID=887456 RepID=A0ABW1MAL4_9ACTN
MTTGGTRTPPPARARVVGLDLGGFGGRDDHRLGLGPGGGATETA